MLRLLLHREHRNVDGAQHAKAHAAEHAPQRAQAAPPHDHEVDVAAGHVVDDALERGVGDDRVGHDLVRKARLRGSDGSDAPAELPVLLDVVTLGLSAGLSFDSSLELYCSRYDNELSRAFSGAMLEWRIGAATREEALRRLADETGLAALERFSSMVGEALAFGTPLAGALERQAELLREEQRAQVEEEIERVPVKMLVPLGTLIVPAMFLAILGPLLGSALVVA